MRTLLMLIVCVALAVPAVAKKPVHEAPPIPQRVPCGLVNVVYDWDFAAGVQGFTTGGLRRPGRARVGARHDRLHPRRARRRVGHRAERRLPHRQPGSRW